MTLLLSKIFIKNIKNSYRLLCLVSLGTCSQTSLVIIILYHRSCTDIEALMILRMKALSFFYFIHSSLRM